MGNRHGNITVFGGWPAILNGWILIGPKRNKETSAKKEILSPNSEVNRICAIFSAETAQKSDLQVFLIDTIRLRVSKLHPLKIAASFSRSHYGKWHASGRNRYYWQVQIRMRQTEEKCSCTEISTKWQSSQ